MSNLIPRAVPLLCLVALVSGLGCSGSGVAIKDRHLLRAAGVEGIDERVTAEGGSHNGKVDHYAVLLGAHVELRHRGNLSMAYQVLIEQGYKRENVYILESEGDATFFPTTDIATRATVHRLFAHLKQIVEPQDTLLIYVTGHGSRVTATSESNGAKEVVGVSTIKLNETEELADWEFAALLDGLNPAAGIAFFDQCYGAIFASTTKSCNFVFITTAAEDETSYGVTFPRAFWSAFRGNSRGLAEPTVLQAYIEATQADKGTRMGYNRPQITHACIDPSRLTLLGEAKNAGTVLSAREASGGALLDSTSAP